MTPLNPAIFKAARFVAEGTIDRGAPPEGIYPVPVGNASLYLSADRDQIIGPDTITVGTTVFYLGFRRSDRHSSP